MNVFSRRINEVTVGIKFADRFHPVRWLLRFGENSDIIDPFKKNNKGAYIMERVVNFLKEADPCKSKGGNLCI